MQSTLEELTCGVCSKLINDPYKLPCGHTFCLRPCILTHAKSEAARCSTCHLEFKASELRPNYLVAAKLHLRLQDKSEKENNSSETPKVLDLVKSRNQTRCSICQKSADENELKYCQHCNRNVCQTCLEKHFDSYSLQVRIQLTSMQRKETELKTRLENLKTKLSATNSRPTHPGKAAIILQLDEAISQLKAAVSQSLENALRKVEVLEIDGSTVLKVKVDDLLASSSDLKEVKGIYEQLEYGTIRKLEDAEKIFLHLRDVKEKARSLLDSSDPLPLLPIMQFELSNRVQENIEKLEEIDMIVGCGSVPLSSLLADHGVRIKNPVERGSSTAIISKVKLYVGGLRRTHTEEHLKRHFENKYGPLVDCHVVKDIKTKESRGFGFVTFREAIHASRALADFPHFIEGVPIQVRPYKFANADGNKAPLGEASSRQTKQKPPRHRVVVVGISDTTTKGAIKTALSKIGPVINVDKEPNRGFATVNFEKPEAVDKAVLLSQIRINDNDCEIYPYNVRKKVIRDREGGEKGSSEDVDELRLFIGNLNPSVNRDLLKGHFSIFGNVTKVDIIYDHGSSKPRGMAFVNMSTVQEVEAVLKARPHIIDSKELIVRKAYKKNSEFYDDEITWAIRENLMKSYKMTLRNKEESTVELYERHVCWTASRARGVCDYDLTGVGRFSYAIENPKQSQPLKTTEASKDTTMIIHDIPVNTSRQDILECFSKFGGITSLTIQDKERNGILSFASPQALQEALKTSSHSVRGKDLRVACHQNPLANHSTESKKTLYVRVGDIAPLTTQLELRVCLAQFGGVLEASVVKTGTQLHAIVKMISFEAVQKALESKGLKICGQYVTVRRFYPESRMSTRRKSLRRRRFPIPSTSKSDPPRAEIKEGSGVIKAPSLKLHQDASVRRRFPLPSTSKSDPPRTEIKGAPKGGSEVTKRSSLLKTVLDHDDIIDSHGDEIINGDAYRYLPFWELF